MPTDPTAESILADYLPRIGRTACILTHVLELQKRILPGVIALANETEAYDVQLPNIESWHIGGSKIGNKFPAMVVSSSSEMQTMGMGGTFRANGNLVVAIVFGPTEDNRSIVNALDLATLARAVLLPFVGGQCDAQGRNVWNQLICTAESPVRFERPDCVGFASHFETVQYPSNNRWITS